MNAQKRLSLSMLDEEDPSLNIMFPSTPPPPISSPPAQPVGNITVITLDSSGSDSSDSVEVIEDSFRNIGKKRCSISPSKSNFDEDLERSSSSIQNKEKESDDSDSSDSVEVIEDSFRNIVKKGSSISPSKSDFDEDLERSSSSIQNKEKESDDSDSSDSVEVIEDSFRNFSKKGHSISPSKSAFDEGLERSSSSIQNKENESDGLLKSSFQKSDSKCKWTYKDSEDDKSVVIDYEHENWTSPKSIPKSPVKANIIDYKHGKNVISHQVETLSPAREVDLTEIKCIPSLNLTPIKKLGLGPAEKDCLQIPKHTPKCEGKIRKVPPPPPIISNHGSSIPKINPSTVTPSDKFGSPPNSPKPSENVADCNPGSTGSSKQFSRPLIQDQSGSNINKCETDRIAKSKSFSVVSDHRRTQDQELERDEVNDGSIYHIHKLREYYISCPGCKEKFKSILDGMEHFKIKHKQKRCPRCLNSFPSTGNEFIDHVRTHFYEPRTKGEIDERITCRFCEGRPRYHYKIMWKHIAEMHLEPPAANPPDVIPSLSTTSTRSKSPPSSTQTSVTLPKNVLDSLRLPVKPVGGVGTCENVYREQENYVFTEQQRHVMIPYFLKNPNQPWLDTVEEVATKLEIKKDRVENWFTSTRMLFESGKPPPWALDKDGVPKYISNILPNGMLLLRRRLRKPLVLEKVVNNSTYRRAERKERKMNRKKVANDEIVPPLVSGLGNSDSSARETSVNNEGDNKRHHDRDSCMSLPLKKNKSNELKRSNEQHQQLETKTSTPETIGVEKMDSFSKQNSDVDANYSREHPRDDRVKERLNSLEEEVQKCKTELQSIRVSTPSNTSNNQDISPNQQNHVAPPTNKSDERQNCQYSEELSRISQVSDNYCNESTSGEFQENLQQQNLPATYVIQPQQSINHHEPPSGMDASYTGLASSSVPYQMAHYPVGQENINSNNLQQCYENNQSQPQPPNIWENWTSNELAAAYGNLSYPNDHQWMYSQNQNFQSFMSSDFTQNNFENSDQTFMQWQWPNFGFQGNGTDRNEVRNHSQRRNDCGRIGQRRSSYPQDSSYGGGNYSQGQSSERNQNFPSRARGSRRWERGRSSNRRGQRKFHLYHQNGNRGKESSNFMGRNAHNSAKNVWNSQISPPNNNGENANQEKDSERNIRNNGNNNIGNKNREPHHNSDCASSNKDWNSQRSPCNDNYVNDDVDWESQGTSFLNSNEIENQSRGDTNPPNNYAEKIINSTIMGNAKEDERNHQNLSHSETSNKMSQKGDSTSREKKNSLNPSEQDTAAALPSVLSPTKKLKKNEKREGTYKTRHNMMSKVSRKDLAIEFKSSKRFIDRLQERFYNRISENQLRVISQTKLLIPLMEKQTAFKDDQRQFIDECLTNEKGYKNEYVQKKSFKNDIVRHWAPILVYAIHFQMSVDEALKDFIDTSKFMKLPTNELPNPEIIRKMFLSLEYSESQL